MKITNGQSKNETNESTADGAQNFTMFPDGNNERYLFFLVQQPQTGYDDGEQYKLGELNKTWR